MEKRAQRQGVNFLIQGTAADLFKIAVVRVSKILEGKKSKLVNFVHDEIQLYMHKDELDLLPKIKAAMEDWHFTVPIIAEFSQADPSWGKKKGLEIHV
jgi:DNA polymerase-1